MREHEGDSSVTPSTSTRGYRRTSTSRSTSTSARVYPTASSNGVEA
jgi:hypothetical protein